jgi:formate dehydrogenase subunit delta
MQEGVALLASHINDFWEPRMRRQLFAVLDAGGAGLRQLVLDAAGAIRRPAAEQAA